MDTLGYMLDPVRIVLAGAPNTWIAAPMRLTLTEIRLAVQRDEMGHAIVEGVPKAVHPSALGSRHAETVLESCEVSGPS